MKPILEKIFLEPSQSIHLHKASHKALDYPLHYAPDHEIIYIEQGHGTSIVGNSISSFADGDLVLVGANVPHVWKSDKEYFDDDFTGITKILVIHFNPDFLGKGFIEVPEMTLIRKLYKTARRGIRFHGKPRNRMVELMKAVFEVAGQDRIIRFIHLLHEMSKVKEYELLSNIEYHSVITDEECVQINKVYEYLFKNYSKEIDFRQISSLVNMSAPSLCRYFKKHTQKTITDVLNEIRVRQACKLLSTNKANAKEACYMSGFNNYSHYNKQFKKIVGKTPLHYQKEYNI